MTSNTSTTHNKVVKTLVPLAKGFEPIEAMTIIDILRRGKFQLDIVSMDDTLEVMGCHDVCVKAEKSIKACANNTYDLIVLPGGQEGSINLAKCDILKRMLQENQANNRYFAAICAAPYLVLHHHGLLKGYRATCYPSFELPPEIKDKSTTVICKNCITSQGPATAMGFALTLLRVLGGDDLKKTVSDQLLYL